MRAKRGLFWYVDGQLLCFPILDDETNEINNNHQRFWKTLPHSLTRGKAYNEYPRGRVELRWGKAVVYLNPRLCVPEIYAWLRQAFSLSNVPVAFKADGSRHYFCALDKLDKKENQI